MPREAPKPVFVRWFFSSVRLTEQALRSLLLCEMSLLRCLSRIKWKPIQAHGVMIQRSDQRNTIQTRRMPTQACVHGMRCTPSQSVVSRERTNDEVKVNFRTNQSKVQVKVRKQISGQTKANFRTNITKHVKSN